MRKLFSFFALFCCFISCAFCDEATVDGIKYEIVQTSRNNSAAKVSGILKSYSKLEIPETIRYNYKDYLVEGISSNAFGDSYYAEHIVIKSPNFFINEKAFANCGHLRKLTIEKSVNTLVVSSLAFSQCPEFKTMEINSQKVVDSHSKDFKKNFPFIETLVYGSSVTEPRLTDFDGALEIDSRYVVYNTYSVKDSFPKITALKYGDEITTVRGGAWSYHNYLRKFEGRKVTIVDDMAFYRCQNLEDVDFSNVIAIGECSFESTALTDVVLGLGTKVVGSYAFAECKKLFSVDFNGVCLRHLNDNVFSGCSHLARVEHFSADSVRHNAFSDCGKLSFIDLSKVKYFGRYAFAWTGLKDVAIGSADDLTIEEGVFQYCNFNTFINNATKGHFTAEANAFGSMTVSNFILDHSDSGLLLDAAKPTTIVVTETENMAQEYIKKGVVNAISRNRLKLAADVNGDGTLSGDDAQSVYNSMH